MLSSSRERALLVLLALGSLLNGASASAESTTATQVLDRVNVVSPKAVLDMAFDDPAQTYPFEVPPAIKNGRGFSACQVTASKGLVCIDQNTNGAPGRLVRKWDPVTADGEINGDLPTPYLFSCEDANLGLDTSKGVETCTAVTVDEKGGVVVAGKRKSGYNLIKVAALADLPNKVQCTNNSGWNRFALSQSAAYCFKILVPRDRPLLVDATYATLTFPGPVSCTGVLGLENRTDLMFFSDPSDTAPCSNYKVTQIADSKTWALDRGELLQGATVVNFPDNGPSFALVVSSKGVVRAKQTDVALQAPVRVKLTRARGDVGPFDSMAALRSSPNAAPAPDVPCATSAQKYGIRTSTKSGRLYITDNNNCEVSSLKPASSSTLSSSASEGLEMVEFPANSGLDLVLGTRTTFVDPVTFQSVDYQYPPLDPTLAPGISIDLSKCADENGCVLAADTSGTAAATLSKVKLASNAKGMTLFQVRGIPDCRYYIAQQAAAATPSTADDYPVPTDSPTVLAENRAICNAAVTLTPSVVSPTTGDPEHQYLNLRPLLPKDVTDQYPPQPSPDALPDAMYISPEYRAQVSEGRYTFDAFFGVTQAGVVFQDTFSLELKVAELTATESGPGNQLGCWAPIPSSQWPQYVSTLLEWDIAVTISEKVKVVGGPSGPLPLSYSDFLVNSYCGSTGTLPPRWSAYPYNLEVSPKTYHAPNDPNYWDSNWPAANGGVPEDLFAHLVVDLFYDLRAAQTNTACQAGGPLSLVSGGSLCTNLASTWANAKDKLEKCLAGSNYPKTSEAVRNCGSFDSQMSNYLGLINAVSPLCVKNQTSPCIDPENRLGELKSRASTILHVFDDRLLPSVPSYGFRYPKYENIDANGKLPP